MLWSKSTRCTVPGTALAEAASSFAIVAADAIECDETIEGLGDTELSKKGSMVVAHGRGTGSPYTPVCMTQPPCLWLSPFRSSAFELGNGTDSRRLETGWRE